MLKAKMSTTGKTILFGTVSGLIWSLIPGVLVGLFESGMESIEVLSAGLLTGIIVTLGLKSTLKANGKGWAFIAGLFSLPFGAFVFGTIFSIIHPSGAFVDCAYGLSNAPTVGVEFAVLSVISLFAVMLFPLAVLTTFLLRHVIHSSNKRVS